MAKYLDRKTPTSVFRARLRIPKDLQGYFGKVRFLQSLGTKDCREAHKLAMRCVVIWQGWMDEARGAQVNRNTPEFWQHQIAFALGNTPGAGNVDPVGFAEHGLSRAANIAAGITEIVDDKGRLEVFDRSDDEEVDAALAYTGPTAEQATARDTFRRDVIGRGTPTIVALDDWLANMVDHGQSDLNNKRRYVTAMADKFPAVNMINKADLKSWFEDQIATGTWSKSYAGAIKSTCGAYWGELQDRGLVSDDLAPFAFKLARETGKAKRNRKRLPWSPQDAVTILDTLITGTFNEAGRQLKRPDQDEIDYTKISMLTGMRGIEIGKLRIEHIHGLDGNLPYYTIEDAKTEAGNRRVPVHSQLVETFKRRLGDRTTGYFMNHADPGDTSKERQSGKTQNVGNLYRKLSKAGTIEGDRRDFHSFRRTAVTILRDARVPEDVVAALVGHDHDTMTFGHYAGDEPLEMLSEALEKIVYPGLQ